MCLPISEALRDELIKNGYTNAMVVQGEFLLDEPNPEYYDNDNYDYKNDELISEEEIRKLEEEKYKALHYWVEINGLIVDITASQFNDELTYDVMPPIVIDTYANLERYKSKEITL